MAKDKIRRFEEFRNFSHAFDFPYHLRGKWHEQVFANDFPLTLELGCGKGEYTVALASQYRQRNFIGIDIKSNRMWKGATLAQQYGLHNAVFLRAVIHKLYELFEHGEADEIWITFPDPFPKPRHAKHRLTHPRFLTIYKQVLKPGGLVHFKTDDTELFCFTMDMLPQIGITPHIIDWDVHANPNANAHLKSIRTHYENLFMSKGRTIKYACFTLDSLDEKRAISFARQLETERKQAALSASENKE